MQQQLETAADDAAISNLPTSGNESFSSDKESHGRLGLGADAIRHE